MHLTMAKKKLRFSIFALSQRLYNVRGSEVTAGSEKTIQFFFTEHICSRGVKWNMF